MEGKRKEEEEREFVWMKRGERRESIWLRRGGRDIVRIKKEKRKN